MTFRNIKDWGLACPECGFENKPDEGHVNLDDEFILRYVCVKCDQKYERREPINQVTVVPLMKFRRPKTRWE